MALDEVGATEVRAVEPELEDALLEVVESSVDVVVVAAAPVAPACVVAAAVFAEVA